MLSEDSIVSEDEFVDPANIAFCSVDKDKSISPAPLYLRPADAALPSEMPPQMLP